MTYWWTNKPYSDIINKKFNGDTYGTRISD